VDLTNVSLGIPFLFPLSREAVANAAILFEAKLDVQRFSIAYLATIILLSVTMNFLFSLSQQL